MTFSDSTTPLLSIGEVCRRYNLSATTIRRAHALNHLQVRTLPSGHRRFAVREIEKWLGVDDEKGEAGRSEGGGAIQIAAVVRVSSDNQARKNGGSKMSSLDHQEKRVLDFISEKWKGKDVRVTMYKSIGSGMNYDRRRFLDLVSDIVEGRYRNGFIVATDATRIARFGVKLISFLAQKYGATIVYTMEKEDQSLNETLADEILSILTHYTARANGTKAREIQLVKLTEIQLKKAYSLQKSGMSLRGIAEEFILLGWEKNENGKPITRHVLRSRLLESASELNALYGDQKQENSFVVFVNRFIRTARNDKATISRERLVETYSDFCTKNKMRRVSDSRVNGLIEQLGWDRKVNAQNKIIFRGLFLNYKGARPRYQTQRSRK